jgi:thiol-disulfide isomerase/thioredoxin
MVSRSLIVGLLALALAGGCDRQDGGNRQASAGPGAVPPAVSPDEAPAAAPVAAAKAGTVDRSHQGEAASAATFQRPDGEPTTLAAFAGTPVLVNLWATWCAPCVKELPTLDALAVDGARPAVLAIAQDTNADTVAPFLAARGLHRLRPYRDPKMALSLAYQANLPVTILFDARGREVWRVPGARDWTSAESRKLLAEAS